MLNIRGAIRRLSRNAAAVTCLAVVITAGTGVAATAEPVPEPNGTATTSVTTEPTLTEEPTATPSPVTVTAATAGTKVIGAVTNIWGTATGAPGAPVTVQVLDSGSWSTVGTGTTDTTGYYAVPLTYGSTTPGTYTFRAVVTVAGTQYLSPDVTLTRIEPAVTVTAATAGTKAVGAVTNIWGTATGAPGAEVTVQALVDGSWSTSRTGTTDTNGYYAVPLTYGSTTPGTYTFRAVVTVAGTQYLSPDVTLTRTGPAVTVTAATAGTKAVGAVTNIWGTATGAPGAPVTVQALVNGSWSTSRTGTTDTNGYYAVPLTYGSTTPGTYTFRAVVTVAGTQYLSPNVTLTRTRTLDARCYTSGVVICASKSDRKVYYVNKGKIVQTLDARFGGRAYDVNGRQRIYSTAEGTFSITRKIRDEWSYTYNVRMPFSSYFYGGQAFHYSDSFARDGWVGDWGSHGCVNLRSWSGAEWLYNNSPVGTKVVVYR